MAIYHRPIILAAALVGIALTVDTNADTFIIDTDVDGSLTGTNGPDTFIFNANVTGTVSGLAGDDVFILNDGGSAGLIDGGSDIDTIQGTSFLSNTFVVNAVESGTVNGSAFANVENLAGGSATDTFVVSAALSGTASGQAGDDAFEVYDGGSVGAIDGGSDIDTVSFAASTAPVTVSPGDFINIENLVGSASASDTLLGTAGVDNFDVTASDAGNVDGLSFSGFENLAGLGGADLFNLNASVTGTVNGGASDDTFVVSAALSGTASGQAGDDVFILNDGGSAGLIDGGSDIDTIQGTSFLSNTFVVNAVESGTVNGSAFANVENLAGGSATDTFVVSAALSGTASGQAGDDAFEVYDGGSVGAIDGGSDIDTVSFAASTAPVTVSPGDFINIENLVGSASASDTLLGTAGVDNFDVTASDAGNVDGLSFSGFENLAGLGGADVFEIAAGISTFIDGGSGVDKAIITLPEGSNLVLFAVEIVEYVAGDTDGDGVSDDVDNCPDIPNPSQSDLDSDGEGDVCDSDVDGDGDPNTSDPDDDNDGLSDVLEDAFGTDPFDPDSDHDGIGDLLDVELGNPTNFCIAADIYTFSESTIDGPLTCAAKTSITVSPLSGSLVEVLAAGNLHLIAPIINIESGFGVAGLLTVTSADPCPGCSP